MKGYKALNMNMCSNYGDMLYELGKEYIIEGKLIMCKNGYHFCKELVDVFTFYNAGDCRVFEIDTLNGRLIVNHDKCCSDRIKLVRELTTEEIKHHIEKNLDALANDNNMWQRRETAANFGFCLDKLVDDEDVDVRIAVAKQKYGLDKLINDPSWYVRLTVADQGYGLDILVNDTDEDVRCAVAKQGYGLDKLVNDEYWRVRYEVADQGYGLDTLINDKNWYVRLAVAKHGYGLDKLVNDNHWQVRLEVARHGHGLFKLAEDPEYHVRRLANELLSKRGINK